MLDLYMRSYQADLTWTLNEIDPAMLSLVAELFLGARADGRQILLLGNGGSAATASHMACDLGKGTVDFSQPDFARFRVISLTDNTALITALGNDLSFDDIFVEQLRIVSRPGDVVVLISASGNSPNLVKAAEYARASGATTIGLLGFGGGKLGRMVDHPLIVSSRNYGIAEDFHVSVQHVLTQYLRRALAGPARPVAFLDRDGVINERPAPHAYVENWEQFRFVDGALSALRTLSAQGFALIVVTNQQGIGKGTISPETLSLIHDRMRQVMADEGVPMAGVFHCPHLEQLGCFCRKPKPGLIHRALNETPFLIDMPQSVLIGDTETDVQAGLAAGLRTVLVGSPGAGGSGATHVVPRLADAVAWLGVGRASAA
jgi:D-sedoheptulose 7-phosphate isomerase